MKGAGGVLPGHALLASPVEGGLLLGGYILHFTCCLAVGGLPIQSPP